MNAVNDAMAALGSVPGWDPRQCRITELKGGLTNRVYHVRAAGRECVLRLDSQDVGHDRRCESRIMAAAGEAGLAPAVLYADPDAGIFVTEYLHGKVWQHRDLESHDKLEALAELLRRVHALPVCESTIDLTAFAEHYARSSGIRDDQKVFASRCVRIVRARSLQDEFTCCHNDVVANNIIESGGLKLIDWEYAGDNDPFYDLASLVGYHDLGMQSRQVLLGAYAGGLDRETEDRLAEQLRIFDAIQWLWLAARQGAAPHGRLAVRLDELQKRIR